MSSTSFGSLTSILHNSPAEATFVSDRTFSQSARSIQTRFNPRASGIDDLYNRIINSLPAQKNNSFQHHFLSEIHRSDIDPISAMHNGQAQLRDGLDQCLKSNASFEGPQSPILKHGSMQDMLKNVIPSNTTISTPNSNPSHFREPSFEMLPKKSLLKMPNQSNADSRKPRSVRISDQVEVIEVENWKIFNTDVAQSNLSQEARVSSACLIF